MSLGKLDGGRGRTVEVADHVELDTRVFLCELVNQFLTQVSVGASQAHRDRHCDFDLGRSVDDTLSDNIALHDSAENVDKNSLDPRVRGQNLERGSDLLCVGAATDIKEVGGHASLQLNYVHRRHCQTSTVHEAADVAFQTNIVQTDSRSFSLVRISIAGGV